MIPLSFFFFFFFFFCFLIIRDGSEIQEARLQNPFVL